jgi:hypothetical protein
MSVLSGESDMASLLSLLPQLIESGNYKVSIQFYSLLSFHFLFFYLIFSVVEPELEPQLFALAETEPEYNPIPVPNPDLDPDPT